MGTKTNKINLSENLVKLFLAWRSSVFSKSWSPHPVATKSYKLWHSNSD